MALCVSCEITSSNSLEALNINIMRKLYKLYRAAVVVSIISATICFHLFCCITASQNFTSDGATFSVQYKLGISNV